MVRKPCEADRGGRRAVIMLQQFGFLQRRVCQIAGRRLHPVPSGSQADADQNLRMQLRQFARTIRSAATGGRTPCSCTREGLLPAGRRLQRLWREGRACPLNGASASAWASSSRLRPGPGSGTGAGLPPLPSALSRSFTWLASSPKNSG